MTQTSTQRHMHEQVTKMPRCKQNKESQTRWHKARIVSIKEAKHVITQRGELKMLKAQGQHEKP